MRKLSLVLLGCMLAFGLPACGRTGQQEGRSSTSAALASKEEYTASANNKEENNAGVSNKKGNSNVLVAYFTVSEDVSVSDNDAVAGTSIVVKNSEKMGNTEYVAKLVLYPNSF